MRCTNLALVLSVAGDTTGGSRTVVLGHVDLELLGVGAGGGLPAAVLVGRVEVVGQVLGLRVAHFPVGGEAGLLDEGKKNMLAGCLGTAPWCSDASLCSVLGALLGTVLLIL